MARGREKIREKIRRDTRRGGGGGGGGGLDYEKKTSRVDGVGDAKRVNSGEDDRVGGGGGGSGGGGGDRGWRWIGVVGRSKGASVEGAF